ncbi:peptidase M19 [Salinibacter sp. 10B]|uniref:dipeptidase n=1 Tax=Salinibacter sp. 10B TaxID=1923971 RepID=UPI000CF3CCB6|nr:membrane dipeptidase [Salinibacter sp. 10B]PQJ35612.1 peptidase M19 [Salinibacter sp. 10B]
MLRLVLYAISGFLVLAVVGYFTIAAPIADARFNKKPDAPSAPVSDRAQAVHDTTMVADLHNDLLLWPRDPLTRYDRGHTDVPRLRDGNVGLQVFAAVTQVPQGRSYAGTDASSLDQIPFLAAAQRWPPRTWTSRLDRALYQARKLHRALERDEQLTLIRTQADLNQTLDRRSETPEVLGTLLAVEGLHALEGDATNVDTLVEAGYCMMSLTHLFDNALGGSSTGLKTGGLTDFGEDVLGRLKNQNVILDLAHASEALIDDVLVRTEEPVVVSHTGVRGTCDSPRNLSDRHIKAIAKQGGLIGIGIWERAVCGDSPAATARAMRHVADLVGVEHVALGTDFDGTVSVPFDAAGLPYLTEALLDAGFSPNEIQKIMSGNVVRVLRETLPSEQ